MDRFGQDIYAAKSSVDESGSDKSVSVEYDKYRKIVHGNTVPDAKALVFLVGFCLGMVFFYLSGVKFLRSGSLPEALLAKNISKLRDFDFYGAGLLEYTALKRMGQLIFLFICATSVLRNAFSYAFLGWGGFELGIVIFSLSHQYGFKGTVLGVLLFIPHGIFFLISFMLLFGKNIADDKKDYHKYRCIMENRLHNKVTKIRRTTVILSCWVIGILSEVYINSEIIKTISVFFE